MNKETKSKLDREVRSLAMTQIPSTKRTVVVAPTVTRRPVLDEMLGHMTVVAQYFLSQMAQKALNYGEFTKDELKQFKEISETVIRQTRAEMEVEKHVEARAKTASDRDLALKIAEKLQEKGIGDETIIVVLEELGLEL